MHHPFINLANPGLANLIPYQPGKPIDELHRELGLDNIIKLASNENPLGPSQHAIAAAQEAVNTSKLYPDGSGYALKQRLSEALSITSDRITLGNGSDNILKLVTQAFLRPNEEVVLSEYGFSTFSIITRAHNGIPVFAKAKQWGHDLSAMLALINNKTRLIFIANPNNPTGTWVNHEDLQNFLSEVPEQIIVVIDEAYMEYVDQPEYPNSIALQEHYPNLISTRSFSKFHGLAGLRVGYGISHPEIADLLNRIRLPFNVNSCALAAAIAALDDEAHQQAVRAFNLEGMQMMRKAYTDLAIDFIPSVTNFLTIDCKQPADAVYLALLKQGIIVRPLLPYAMPNHLRISIGFPEDNAALMNALPKVL